MEDTAVFIGSISRGRERTYLARCNTCGGGYHIAARTMREMRQQGRLPVCKGCRTPNMVNPEPHRAWAAEVFSKMSPSDRALVAVGFGIARSDLALSASAMTAQ